MLSGIHDNCFANCQAKHLLLVIGHLTFSIAALNLVLK